MSSQAYEVVERKSMEYNDISALGALMAQSFGKEASPFHLASYGQPYEWPESCFWSTWSSCKVAVGYNTGLIFTVNDKEGFAMCFPPGVDFDMRKGGQPYNWAAHAWSANSPDYLRYLQHVLHPALEEAELKADPNYMNGFKLMALCVEEDKRNQGIGSALIKTVCGRAQELECDVFLHVDKEATLPFYEKRGFEILHHTMLPDKHEDENIPWWILRRKFAKE